ncbi:hypothetical protein C8R44DRAFT_984738 [Mycena epipterygia]|nr:hypothetical protein C8R44DRAFT_984738 [Mycena epipterygia]
MSQPTSRMLPPGGCSFSLSHSLIDDDDPAVLAIALLRLRLASFSFANPLVLLLLLALCTYHPADLHATTPMRPVSTSPSPLRPRLVLLFLPLNASVITSNPNPNVHIFRCPLLYLHLRPRTPSSPPPLSPPPPACPPCVLMWTTAPHELCSRSRSLRRRRSFAHSSSSPLQPPRAVRPAQLPSARHLAPPSAHTHPSATLFLLPPRATRAPLLRPPPLPFLLPALLVSPPRISSLPFPRSSHPPSPPQLSPAHTLYPPHTSSPRPRISTSRASHVSSSPLPALPPRISSLLIPAHRLSTWDLLQDLRTQRAPPRAAPRRTCYSRIGKVPTMSDARRSTSGDGGTRFACSSTRESSHPTSLRSVPLVRLHASASFMVPIRPSRSFSLSDMRLPALLSSLPNEDAAARSAPSSSGSTSNDDGGARPSGTRSRSTSMPSHSPLSAPRSVLSTPPSCALAPLPVLRPTTPPHFFPPPAPRSPLPLYLFLLPAPRSRSTSPLPPLSFSALYALSFPALALRELYALSPPLRLSPASSCLHSDLVLSASASPRLALPNSPLRSPLLPQPPPSRYTASPSSPPRPNRDTCHRIT